ncbi:MAG TPA: glycosyltransferase family 61 protein [Phenylobacterium sp.]
MIISQLPSGPYHLLDNVNLVSGTSLVYSRGFHYAWLGAPFDPEKEYLQEEVGQRIVRQDTSGQITFRFHQPIEATTIIDSKVVPLNLLHYTNYYHFLIECLPSLLYLVSTGVVDKHSVLATGLLHPNMWFGLHYAIQNLGAAMGQDIHIPIFQSRAMHAIQCRRAVLPAPSSHASELIGGGLTDYSYNAGNIRLLRETFKPQWTNPTDTPRRKLFIQRNSNYRRVSNAQPVEEMATRAGYEVVDPGQLNFLEQVRLFSSASRIIGPTGAWASNIVFVPDDAKVTVFYPDATIPESTCWGGLGRACGVQVDDLYAPISNRYDFQPIHSDFTIPEERLADLLLQ